MKVGVIGAGVMGKLHLRVYRELGVELVGVADIDFDKAEKVATQYGTKAYCDNDELLKQGLDAVSIAVPTSQHKVVALAAIQRGINLLVEKPIADSIQNAKEIVVAAESRKVKFMVGYLERFNPAVRKLKQIIDDGTLGKLVCLSSRRVAPFVPRISDVGIIVDSGTHDIDIIRYLTGSECTSISAKVTRYRNVEGDAAMMLLGFGDISATIEVNWYNPYKIRSLTVTGTVGVAYLDYIKQELEIYNVEQKVIPLIDKAEPLKLELAHFLDCIKSDKEPLVSGFDGIKVLEIALNVGQVSMSQEK